MKRVSTLVVLLNDIIVHQREAAQSGVSLLALWSGRAFLHGVNTLLAARADVNATNQVRAV